MSVFGAQQRQCAQHSGALVAGRGLLAVEAFDQQGVTIADGGQSAFCRKQPALAREQQARNASNLWALRRADAGLSEAATSTISNCFC